MKRLDTVLLLGAITVGGLVLRAHNLDAQPLWWDEGYSLFFATRDVVTMLERTALDIHPPLYYALLRVWMNIAGTSAATARWFSVLIGTATIPLLYALARQLFSARVARVAALLLALSPLHIYYSQEVRMYGLVTLLGIASVYFFVRLRQMTPGKPSTARVALAYILVTTAALYTQYYAAFILASQIVVLCVWTWQERQSPSTDRSAHLAHWFAIVLLYLPWVLYAGPKLYAYVTAKVAIEKYAPLDPVTFLARHLAAFSVGHLTAWTTLAWASIIIIALAILGLTKTFRQPVSSSPALPLSLLLFVPLAFAYLVNLLYPFHPIRGERLLLLAAPAFYLFVARGIDALWQHRARFGALAILLIAIVSASSLADFYNVPRYPHDDYRPLIAEVQSLAQPGDTFLAIYPWQIGYLEAYYTGAPLRVVEVTASNWQTAIENVARVWLPALQTQGRILEDALAQTLRARAYSILDQWHGTTRLEFYAFVADPPLPRAPRNIVFEDNTTLGDVAIAREPLVAGRDILPLRFVGSTRAPTIASFRLLDKNETVWAQSDREIARDTQRLGIALPLGLPPGEYALRVTAYRADTRARLRLKDSEQESALLATIEVITPTQPNLAALPHRTQIDFGNGMSLVGYDVPPTVAPGFATPFTLFWQATRAPEREFIIVTQIQNGRGNVFATTQAVPARGIHPTTRWHSGEMVRDPQTLLLRGDTLDGDYRIVVALMDAVTGARTPAREIGTLRVRGRAHYFGAPTPTHTFDARIGEIARLIGYDWSDTPGAQRLVLYWHALATSETSYTVFVHLVDADGAIRAQGDQIPGAGAYPTTSWVKGEYLVDVYDLVLPRGASLDAYTLRVGMYDATNGTRLPVFDANGRPLGDSIRLR